MKVCLEQSRASTSRAPGSSSLFLLTPVICFACGLYLSRAQQAPLLPQLPPPASTCDPHPTPLPLFYQAVHTPTDRGRRLADRSWGLPGAALGHGQIRVGIRRLRPRPGKGGPVAAANRQSQAADGRGQAADGRGQAAPGRSRRGRSGQRGRGSEPRHGTRHGVQPAAPTMPTESPVSFQCAQ